MKKHPTISLILFVCTLTGCAWFSNENTAQTVQHQPHFSSDLTLLTSDGKPHPSLAGLLDLCNIKHDGTLTTIFERTQTAWLRKPGTERWQIDAPEKIARSSALPFFEKIGVLQEIAPTYKEYDYALLFGATTKRIRNRLAYLVSLWQQGTRFKTLVLLGCERPLDHVVDSEASLKNNPQYGLPTRKDWIVPLKLPQTECDMMIMIYNQVELPVEMKKLPIMIVNSPQIKMPEGHMRRATTADTILDWLKMNPRPGRCLFISNQPYVGYQHTVAIPLMPKTFTIDTVGSADKDSDINVSLDSIARWLYQEIYKKPKCLYGAITSS